MLDKILNFFFFFFFWCAGVWTQGLHLEPLHQPFFCDGIFQDRVSWTICLDWFWTVILLISASCVARITGVSHRYPAWNSFLSLSRFLFQLCFRLLTYKNDPSHLFGSHVLRAYMGFLPSLFLHANWCFMWNCHLFLCCPALLFFMKTSLINQSSSCGAST
jgi:hypothetical protein